MEVLPPDFKNPQICFLLIFVFFQRFLLQIDSATESHRTDSLGVLHSCPLYVVGSPRELLPPLEMRNFPNTQPYLTVRGICVPQGMLNALRELR